MADIDILPKRAIPAAALVDSNGVASNGSLTTTQLAARGMASLCAVDGTGTSILGATLAQIARRGIQTFCPVDEFGVAQDSSTADALRKRGISPMVLLDPGGIALTGSANMETLRKRSLGYFCPLDESGNATTMGAVILISNSTIQDISAVGTNVGVLSVVGGTGTYTFTLTNNAGGRFAVAGTNGVNLNTASAVTAGSYAVTVSATNGVTPITRTINILVTLYVPATLTASVGTFTFTGETMTPISGYVVTAQRGAFTLTDPGTTNLVPPAVTWTPASLPNLVAWYKADAGVLTTGSVPATNGQNVIQWNDQSGHGYNLLDFGSLPAVFASTGLNGKPAVVFTRSNLTGLKTASGVAMGTGAPFSSFAVVQLTSSAASNARISCYTISGAANDYDSGGTIFVSRNGSNMEIGSYRGTNAAFLFMPIAGYNTTTHVGTISGGGTYTPYVNNVAGTAQADTQTFVNGGWITVGTGSTGAGANNGVCWDGPISEIVITNAAMSAGDRASLETYFGRW